MFPSKRGSGVSQNSSKARFTPGHARTYQAPGSCTTEVSRPLTDWEISLKIQQWSILAHYLQGFTRIHPRLCRISMNFQYEGCLCPISKSLPVGESLQFFHVVESLRESPWCAASRSSNHWQLASSQHRCHGIGSLHKDGSLMDRSSD